MFSSSKQIDLAAAIFPRPFICKESLPNQIKQTTSRLST